MLSADKDLVPLPLGVKSVLHDDFADIDATLGLCAHVGSHASLPYVCRMLSFCNGSL